MKLNYQSQIEVRDLALLADYLYLKQKGIRLTASSIIRWAVEQMALLVEKEGYLRKSEVEAASTLYNLGIRNKMDARGKKEASREWSKALDDFQTQVNPALIRARDKKMQLLRQWMRTDIDESTREELRQQLEEAEKEVKRLESKQ